MLSSELGHRLGASNGVVSRTTTLSAKLGWLFGPFGEHLSAAASCWMLHDLSHRAVAVTWGATCAVLASTSYS